MTFLDHLDELRSRLFKSILATLAGAIIGLIFCKELFTVLQIPMQRVLPEGSHFIATSLFESYITYFKIALCFGLFIASPFVFYQLWQFLAPGLHPQEKKNILPFAMASALLFLGGALFGYFVVFPSAFFYLNVILEGTAIVFLPSMSDYLGVALTMLLAFGVTFELPLFIFLLGRMGLVTYSHIKQYRRYVIVFLFFLAAILTPGPDVISQCLLAIPLWILFELGGLTLLWIPKRDLSVTDEI